MLNTTGTGHKNHGHTMMRAMMLLLILAFLLPGCGTSPSPDSDPSTLIDTVVSLEESARNSALAFDSKDCTPLPVLSQPGGSFTVALLDSIRPRQAPVPRNASERLVFAQLYETLVKVSCDGSIQPGLADHWTCTDDGSMWVFRIRDGAVLWDGTRITASLVKKAWIRSQKIPAKEDHVSPWAWLSAHSKSVRILDGQRLAIQLPEAQFDFPLLLAHPATAVAIRRPGWQWPVGSGPCRLQASTPAPLPDLNLIPNIHHPQPPIWKNLRFLVKPGLDARDLILLDPDLLIVDNRIAADFFRSAPGFLVSSLPWQRQYLMVCSPKQNPEGNHRWTEPASNMDCFTDISGLAARPWSHLVYPPTRALNCPQLTGPIPRSAFQTDTGNEVFLLPNKNTLLYCAEDAGSQEIAQRVAALGDGEIRVQGASISQLNLSLEHQSPGAFILAINRYYPSGCLQLASLLGRATWLQKAATTELVSDLGKTSLEEGLPANCALTQGEILFPLLLSHPYLVHKENLAGIELEFDGTLNLGNLGLAQ